MDYLLIVLVHRLAEEGGGILHFDLLQLSGGHGFSPLILRPVDLLIDIEWRRQMNIANRTGKQLDAGIETINYLGSTIILNS